MAQDECAKELEIEIEKAFDIVDELRSILTEMCQSEIVHMNKIITNIKILFQDDWLEKFEREMVSRRKENLETSEQLTLGELIGLLETIPVKGLPIIFDSRYHPTGLSSWRGDYGELAIEYDSDGRVSLSDFLEMLKGAIGKKYEGYKGGSYVMRSDTPLWVANYGNTQGFRTDDEGNYQAVSGVSYSDKAIIIDTTLSVY